MLGGKGGGGGGRGGQGKGWAGGRGGGGDGVAGRGRLFSTTDVPPDRHPSKKSPTLTVLLDVQYRTSKPKRCEEKIKIHFINIYIKIFSFW